MTKSNEIPTKPIKLKWDVEPVDTEDQELYEDESMRTWEENEGMHDD